MMENSDIIFLLARQRSGTNPLRSVLTTHPDIFCLPEVFNTTPTADFQLAIDADYFGFVEKRLSGDMRSALAMEDPAELFLDYLEFLRCFADERYLLVDVKYNSTHHVKPGWRFTTEEPRLFSLLLENQVRILNLTRRNFLRYYVSEQKAQARKSWEAFDPAVVGEQPWYLAKYKDSDRSRPAPDICLRIDIGDMLKVLELCQSESDLITQYFSDYDLYLEVEYQEVFPEPQGPISQAATDRITQWLQISKEFVELRPQYSKQSELPLWETVENWNEVATALQGTQFEPLLEDEPMYRASAAKRVSADAGPAAAE